MSTSNSPGQALVVGISGATCSGKTSVTQRLKKSLELEGGREICVRILCEDDFYKAEDDPTHLRFPLKGTNVINWDSTRAVNYERLVDLLLAEKQSSSVQKVIIVEGITIFNIPQLFELCDLKYFFLLNYAVCQRRRASRNYEPPDPEQYFEAVVWPMYEKNLALLQAHLRDIIYYDGEDIDVRTQRIKDHILSHIETQANDRM